MKLTLVTAALLIVCGVLLVLFGLLALTFNEGGGATYVTLAGVQFDAHLVGALSLVAAAAALAGAVIIVRGRRVGD